MCYNITKQKYPMIQIQKITKNKNNKIHKTFEIKTPLIVLFEGFPDFEHLTELQETFSHIYKIKSKIIRLLNLPEKIISKCPISQVLTFLSHHNEIENQLKNQIDDIILLDRSILASGIVHQGHLKVSSEVIHLLQNLSQCFLTASPDIIYFVTAEETTTQECYRSFFQYNAEAIFSSQYQFFEIRSEEFDHVSIAKHIIDHLR